MKLSQCLVAVAGMAILVSAAFADGNTWYVAKEDANAADTLDTGRGGEALPFRTIQAALDNPAFEAGDTVLVKPGDYDEATYAYTTYPVTAGDDENYGQVIRFRGLTIAPSAGLMFIMR